MKGLEQKSKFNLNSLIEIDLEKQVNLQISENNLVQKSKDIDKQCKQSEQQDMQVILINESPTKNQTFKQVQCKLNQIKKEAYLLKSNQFNIKKEYIHSNIGKYANEFEKIQSESSSDEYFDYGKFVKKGKNQYIWETNNQEKKFLTRSQYQQMILEQKQKNILNKKKEEELRIIDQLKKLEQNYENKIMIRQQKALHQLSEQFQQSSLNTRDIDEQKFKEGSELRKNMLFQISTQNEESFKDSFQLITQNDFNDGLITVGNLQQRQNASEFIKFLLSHNFQYQGEFIQDKFKIPDSFYSYDQYYKIFQYLTYKETLAVIQNSLDKIQKYQLMNEAFQYVLAFKDNDKNNYFTELEIISEQSSQKFQKCDVNFLSINNSLILISNEKILNLDLMEKSRCFNQASLFKKYRKNRRFLLIGFISIDKQNALFEYENCTLSIKTIINRQEFQRLYFEPNQKKLNAFIYPIEKISTQIREFISLNNLKYQELCKLILNPSLISSIQIKNSNNIYPFLNIVKRFYNETQVTAIYEAMQLESGIKLFQGPPGTGKTHTLIGILSGIYYQIQKKSKQDKNVILICAPSNTAIDEIITRIIENGIITENGIQTKDIKLIRIGVIDKETSELVKQTCLDNIVNQRVKEEGLKKEQQKFKQNNISLKEQMVQVERTTKQIKKYQKQKEQNSNAWAQADLQSQIDQLIKQRKSQYQQFCKLKSDKNLFKDKYFVMMRKVLEEAEIICCTLGSSGSEKMEYLKNKIEAVIVDESGQCTEPSNLVPLQYGVNRMILIGDPCQLPATTFSVDSQNTFYNRSLFERILMNGIQPVFLNIQYRMQSEIRLFSSSQFYNDRLIDAEQLEGRNYPFYLQNFKKNNVIFFDIANSLQIKKGNSYYNRKELLFSIVLCTLFEKKLELKNEYIKKNKQKDETFNIGFISPYKEQVAEFKKIIQNYFSKEFQKCISSKTIDSFQGQEKDIIIFSTVRALNEKFFNNVKEVSTIGFTKDPKRMNVALTRAKFVNLILGDSRILLQDANWASFILHVAKNNLYFRISNFQKQSKTIIKMFLNPSKLSKRNHNFIIKRKTKEKAEFTIKNEQEEKHAHQTYQQDFIAHELRVQNLFNYANKNIVYKKVKEKRSKKIKINTENPSQLQNADFQQQLAQNNQIQQQIQIPIIAQNVQIIQKCIIGKKEERPSANRKQSNKNQKQLNISEIASKLIYDY